MPVNPDAEYGLARRLSALKLNLQLLDEPSGCVEAPPGAPAIAACSRACVRTLMIELQYGCVRRAKASQDQVMRPTVTRGNEKDRASYGSKDQAERQARLRERASIAEPGSSASLLAMQGGPSAALLARSLSNVTQGKSILCSESLHGAFRGKGVDGGLRFEKGAVPIAAGQRRPDESLGGQLRSSHGDGW
jgi:hypothetical protein